MEGLECKLEKLSEAKGIENTRVFVRVDYNVPVENGRVTNTERIAQTLPTIKLLKSKGCRIILASHLGRPKGKVDPSQSLAPVALELEKLLGSKVIMAKDCIGEQVKKQAFALLPGEVLLLENTRFHPEEEKNDDAFSKQLAELGEVYVFEAFGTAHRADASTAGIQKHFKKKYIGLLVEKELKGIAAVLRPGKGPRRPFVVVLGGKKVSDKIGVIESMCREADYVLIGGAMGLPFQMLWGQSPGNSYVEEGSLELVKGMRLDLSKIVLPSDYLTAESIESKSAKCVQAGGLGKQDIALDIGPATLKEFTKIISKSATVVWNGPMGVFENPSFSQGTAGIARAVSAVKHSLVGGGDTIAALEQLAPNLKFTHVSTGGGALLELLSGKPLVALNQ